MYHTWASPSFYTVNIHLNFFQFVCQVTNSGLKRQSYHLTIDISGKCFTVIQNSDLFSLLNYMHVWVYWCVAKHQNFLNCYNSFFSVEIISLFQHLYCDCHTFYKSWILQSPEYYTQSPKWKGIALYPQMDQW